MGKLLEYAKVNFWTLCNLIRYQYTKRARVVSSMNEFLTLFLNVDLVS